MTFAEGITMCVAKIHCLRKISYISASVASSAFGKARAAMDVDMVVNVLGIAGLLRQAFSECNIKL